MVCEYATIGDILGQIKAIYPRLAQLVAFSDPTGYERESNEAESSLGFGRGKDNGYLVNCGVDSCGELTCLLHARALVIILWHRKF